MSVSLISMLNLAATPLKWIIGLSRDLQISSVLQCFCRRQPIYGHACDGDLHFEP